MAAMSTGTKVGLTVAVVLGAVGYMIFTTVSSGSALEYFKHVEEVAAEPARWTGQRLQVHGNVVRGTILKRDGSLDYRFALFRQGQWLDVIYSGLVPDNFKDCAELVVTGKLTEPRRFHAEEVSAKCPSKYDGKRQSGCGEELLAVVQAYRAGGR
jgi:cytochrome c-type biogenesis protein CcmE